ncbi:MAG: HAMP domain-containing sensor histidine kinase [Ilumatobacter sp.]|uniref:sensor histidine kinase n=1 Tax=Ilumatobacter sp. TaxID=1967498 RepID=UPI002637B16D|nr:HAMP domain-containing sensor histidine kinase [Ilumatobacter sp.]MDJ0769937.1 HAMP domain-containing sensor histidine kinase [Ilumatobacter sp.]
MRLATRAGLAAFGAALIAVIGVVVVVQARFVGELERQTDDELEARLASAPIVVAVAEQLAMSELRLTMPATRVVAGDTGSMIDLGRVPPSMPADTGEGFVTVSADGERWRVLTTDVTNVPRVGDVATVQLIAPLGDVDDRIRSLRRRLTMIGLIAALLAGAVGYLLGRRAAMPLSQLRTDAAAIDRDDPATWHVHERSGTPDVDEVGAALNSSLADLAAETARRNAALEAARGFASSATHELRTPMQSARTNLDIAASDAASGADRAAALAMARDQLQRAGTGLAAVRTLADAEFADPAWFQPVDLAEIVDGVVAAETARADVVVRVEASPQPPVPLWADGAQLAVANVVRNAVLHGGPADGSPAELVVRVDAGAVAVEDNGPGIPAPNRDRVLRRFERAGATGPGSGLGLAIAHQVAIAHGGSVTIDDSPLGGARVVVDFGSARGS